MGVDDIQISWRALKHVDQDQYYVVSLRPLGSVLQVGLSNNVVYDVIQSIPKNLDILNRIYMITTIKSSLRKRLTRVNASDFRLIISFFPNFWHSLPRETLLLSIITINIRS